MKVIKRNGKIQDFDFNKIKVAVNSAFEAVGREKPLEYFFEELEHYFNLIDNTLSVEKIQDIVETHLMHKRYYNVAKAYILYRDKHATMRETETRKLFESIINVEKNDVTRDNANMNADTPAGMMMKFSAETTKPFVDKYILSSEAKEAVDNNYIQVG